MDPRFLDAKMAADRVARRAALWRRVENPHTFSSSFLGIGLATLMIGAIVMSELDPETLRVVALMALFITYQAAMQKVRLDAVAEILKDETEREKAGSHEKTSN